MSNNNFWNGKYTSSDNLHSSNPNEFLKEKFLSVHQNHKFSSALIPADGDDRNGLLWR